MTKNHSDKQYILVTADEHPGQGKSFSLKGARDKHTTFGEQTLEGYANIVQSPELSFAIRDGDGFNASSAKQLLLSDAAEGAHVDPSLPLNRRLAAVMDTPELYWQELLASTPHVQHQEIIGNHNGMHADPGKQMEYLKQMYAPSDEGDPEQLRQMQADIHNDGQRQYLDLLHTLSRDHANFSFSDSTQIGNLFVKHGHGDVEFYPRGFEVDGNQIYGASYVVKQGDKTKVVPADNYLSLAEAMLEIPSIAGFIHENTSHLKRGQHLDLYVLTGHTHKYWDAKIDMALNDKGEPEMVVPQRLAPVSRRDSQTRLFALSKDDPRAKVTIHISNLGCFLPGRSANAKLLVLENGHVTDMIGIGNMARFADPKVRELGLGRYIEQFRENGKYPDYINGKESGHMGRSV